MRPDLEAWLTTNNFNLTDWQVSFVDAVIDREGHSYVLATPRRSGIATARAAAEAVRLYMQSGEAEAARRHTYQRPVAVDGVAIEDRYDDEYDACIFCDHDWHGLRCDVCACRSSYLEEPIRRDIAASGTASPTPR